jgi:hypothetical protein
LAVRLAPLRADRHFFLSGEDMKKRTWLLLGGLAGLLAGLVLDALVPIAPLYLRIAQVGLILVGAGVSAFVYGGARAVTGGAEPTRSTDRTRQGAPRPASPSDRARV